MATDLDLDLVFHDITPIPQDDGPQPVCGIDYARSYVKAMDYFRAVLRKDEHSGMCSRFTDVRSFESNTCAVYENFSLCCLIFNLIHNTERALDLTHVCLLHNPANYTTWHFRRQILATLTLESTATSFTTKYNIDRVKADLALTSKLGGANPKNYQIWYHRQSLLEGLVKNDEEGLRCTDDELKYTAAVFQEDAKNYHAWSHRQWIVLTVNNPTIWDSELSYTDELIFQDGRNNSAWNHRWFASHRAKKVPLLSYEKALLEAEYALKVAEMDPFNESPWRYLIGILKEQWRRRKENASKFSELLDKYEGNILKMKNDMKERSGADGCSCVNLISAFIDILEMKHNTSAFEAAANFAHQLGMQHDPIRKKYWLLREKELRSRV